jgi:hypothetical protein
VTHTDLMQQVAANRATMEFIVQLVAATFTLVGIFLGIFLRCHERNRLRQERLLAFLPLLNGYASRTLSVSMDTDHKMDAAKEKLESTPIVVVETELIKEKIDKLDEKVEATPARTVAAMQQMTPETP